MSTTSERHHRGPSSCWPMAPLFEGEAIGAVTESNGVADRRGRLQHGAVRLPGGHHRPLLRRSDHHLHLSRTSATTASTPLDDEAARPFCRGVVVRDLARRRSNWRSHDDLDCLPAPATSLAGHRRHRHPTPHPPPAGRRCDARVPSAPPTPARSSRPPPSAEPGTDGTDLVSPSSPAPRPTRSARAPAAWWPMTSASSQAMLTQLGQIGPPSRSCRPATSRRLRSWRGEPDGVFLSNGPGDPAAVGHAIAAPIIRRAARPGADLRHLPRPSAAGQRPRRHPPTSCPSATTAGTIRCGGISTTAAVEITSQNHNYCVDAEVAHLASAELTHVNLNDHTVEGIRCRDVPAFSVQYHPEAGPAPHDARYLFDLVRRSDGRQPPTDRTGTGTR